MTDTQPLVTVVVPVLDEAARIGDCLASLRRQTYPHGSMEVLVVDGGSSDATVAVARAALAGAGFARADVVHNPRRTRPSNLNRGLAEARGRYLCRVDARTRVGPDHVARCVSLLMQRPDAAVVGGRQVATAPRPAAVGAGIARALNNRFTTGLARYRRATASGPADTVYLGAFRADQLREVGGWPEDLPVNEDFDLNSRLRAEGLVWFDADLDASYLPRASVGELFAQYRGFGRAKADVWTSGRRPLPRQWACLAAPPVAAVLGAMAMAAVGGTGRVAFVVSGVAGAAAIDAIGARQPAGLRVRVAALLASAAVAGGWWLGVAGGLLRRAAGGARPAWPARPGAPTA